MEEARRAKDSDGKDVAVIAISHLQRNPKLIQLTVTDIKALWLTCKATKGEVDRRITTLVVKPGDEKLSLDSLKTSGILAKLCKFRLEMGNLTEGNQSPDYGLLCLKLATLITSKCSNSLETLILCGSIKSLSSLPLLAILGTTSWPALKALTIPVAAGAFATAMPPSCLPALRRLLMQGQNLTSDDLDALSNGTFVTQLTKLDLMRYHPGQNFARTPLLNFLNKVRVSSPGRAENPSRTIAVSLR